MKYLITMSLFTSIMIPTIQNQLHMILPLMAGGIFFYWILLRFWAMRQEITLLKEENQYFVDSFENIRNPITLVHTPLKTVCNNNCPEGIKKELLLAVRNIDCLDEHLIRLMNLKQFFMYSESMDITEHELGYFLRNRIYSLRDYAASKNIKVNIKKEFKYVSTWLDQSKISPVIDKFIENAIEVSEPEKDIFISVTLNCEYWEIKMKDSEKGKLMQCYRCKNHLLLKNRTEVEYKFNKGILCQRLMKLCKGKIIVNQSSHTISLRFSVKHPHEKLSKLTTTHMIQNQEEENMSVLFHETSSKRESTKPVVILADSNTEFRTYLEECLSEDFEVKSFNNGLKAFACIKEEHPDLVICDVMLHGMRGNELSSRLKTSGETSIIPIILYGSHIDMNQRNKREASLADTFLFMPFNIEDLKTEMSVLIKNSRFLRKAFLQKVFGEQFLETEPMEVFNESNVSFINQVKDFVLENIDKDDLTIDEIAYKLCMSRTAFYNKWKALTGEAPKFFIFRIRMEKARELLESGKYSVNVIPEMIGLKNLKNFRNKYKKYFKITPSESIKKN